MIALPDESPSQADVPDPEDPWAEVVTPEEALDYVRKVAAQRDPKNARHYATADPARIKDGIDLLRTILAAHLEFQRRTGRGARSGRRAHQAAVREAVLSTNETTYTLGPAWLDAAFGLLPPSRPPRKD